MNNITINKVNDVLYIRGQSWQYCAVGELSKLESTGFQTTSLKHVTKTLKVVDSLSKHNVHYSGTFTEKEWNKTSIANLAKKLKSSAEEVDEGSLKVKMETLNKSVEEK